MASFTASIAFKNWFSFFAACSCGPIFGSIFVATLDNLVKDLILVAFDNTSVIDKGSNPEAVIFTLPSL